MSKSILLTLLSVTGSALCATETFACGRGSCCAATASCAAPAGGAAPADPHAGMKMSQTNRGSMYQSFSYEPGATRPTAPAPMYYAPRPMMRAVPRDPAIHDSGYKVRGGYYPNR